MAKTRSFGFYSDMEEISPAIADNRAADAVEAVMNTFYGRAPQHYATDLGQSLETVSYTHLCGGATVSVRA